MLSTPDLIVLHEHPEWQKPLFAALERRGVSFEPFDVTRAAFSNVEPLRAPVYFNQASPSACCRGDTRSGSPVEVERCAKGLDVAGRPGHVERLESNAASRQRGKQRLLPLGMLVEDDESRAWRASGTSESGW